MKTKTILGKVYVISGDLKVGVPRENYPQTEQELISVIKEAIQSYPKDEMQLGQLMLISRSRNSFFEDDWWIETKSALRKAGFEVREKKEAKP